MFEKDCQDWLTQSCGGGAFLTPSCTAALELACLLTIKPGDEVLVPSFSFPSCSNAVILRGGVPVYVDIDPHTLNMDDVEKSVTGKTRAVMPLHYAGVSCDMEKIAEIAEQYGLYVIEDAAQCIGNFRLRGHFGCISFHATKNVECGEGGAIIVSPEFVEEVELVRDCGTTKAKYRRGESSGYDWLAVGSSCLMSSDLSDILWGQFQRIDEITQIRLKAWRTYERLVQAPKASYEGNGHIFWFLTENQQSVLSGLRSRSVKASQHYEPAHLTPTGMRYGRVYQPITISQYISKRIVRLPTDVTEEEAVQISHKVNEVLYEREGRSVRGVETPGSKREEEACGAGDQREAA